MLQGLTGLLECYRGLFGCYSGLLGCYRGLLGSCRGLCHTVAQGGFLISKYCEAEIWESGEVAKHVARADPATRLQIRILSLESSQLSALPRPLSLFLVKTRLAKCANAILFGAIGISVYFAVFTVWQLLQFHYKCAKKYDTLKYDT